MKEILSQKQIDDLLNGVNSGDIDVEDLENEKNNKKVKLYDFRRPNKFSHEQTKVINELFSSFSNHMTLSLSALVRKMCLGQVLYVDEQTFNEYTNSLPNTSVFGIVNFSPLKGSIIVEITNTIANVMINLVLGGAGIYKKRESNYTDIELSIVKRIVNTFLKPLQEAWINVIELDPSLERVETSGQHIQISAPNDIVTIITLKLKILDTEGLINFCIPYLVIEPVINQLSSKYLFSNFKNEEEKENIYDDILKKNVKDISVNLKCEIGSSMLKMSEIKILQKNDVIKLDKKAGDNVEVLINDKVKYFGQMGRKNKRYAVKILKIAEGCDINAGQFEPGTN